MKRITLLIVVASIFLTACATTPPSNPSNICDIFDDKPDWYSHARRAQKKWDVSIPVMMSIMFQESQFVHNAKPARRKILWIIPGPRKSSAQGFAQVKSETWNEYQRSTGNTWGRRDRFKDAVDFIGWYSVQSRKRSNIRLDDASNLYLAYHEGHGGFNRGTYKNKAWLINIAQQVAQRSSQYSVQLNKCERRLQRSWWWPF